MTRGVLEVAWNPEALAVRYKQWLSQGNLPGVDRHRALLPLSDKAPSLPIALGRTPLLPALRLRDRLAMPKLFLKDDTRNPSASYKDRASALVCLKAAEIGEKIIVAASTGNAATALSCVASALGQQAIIFVPRTAPVGKLVQMLAYGAQVVPVDGTYDQAFELSLEATRQFGWYNRNTAFNPFTIEGKKTSSLEIVEDLGGMVPDVVVVPTGDGVIISGIAKGFRDLHACGAIPKLPRLIAVQAEGSSSISRALQAGIDHPETDPNAHTVADSICVSAPRAGILAVREVKRSGGAGVVVSDDSIVEAIGELARYGSVFAEPAASASLAGLHVALKDGLIRRDETVVLMVTGHGLKDIATAQRIARIPEPIAPNAESLKARLGAIATATN